MQAPKFYEEAPPAPPGLEWWHYKADVPPLPDPKTYFHNQSYARWGWRRDPNFQATEYVFTNLDKTLMTNVADRDPRLWVHLLSSYVISFVVWRVRALLVLGSPSCVAVPETGSSSICSLSWPRGLWGVCAPAREHAPLLLQGNCTVGQWMHGSWCCVLKNLRCPPAVMHEPPVTAASCETPCCTCMRSAACSRPRSARKQLCMSTRRQLPPASLLG